MHVGTIGVRSTEVVIDGKFPLIFLTSLLRQMFPEELCLNVEIDHTAFSLGMYKTVHEIHVYNMKLPSGLDFSSSRWFRDEYFTTHQAIDFEGEAFKIINVTN